MNEPKLEAKQNGAPPLEGQQPEYFLSAKRGGITVVLGMPAPHLRQMTVCFEARRWLVVRTRVIWQFGCS